MSSVLPNILQCSLSNIGEVVSENEVLIESMEDLQNKEDTIEALLWRPSNAMKAMWVTLVSMDQARIKGSNRWELFHSMASHILQERANDDTHIQDTRCCGWPMLREHLRKASNEGRDLHGVLSGAACTFLTSEALS